MQEADKGLAVAPGGGYSRAMLRPLPQQLSVVLVEPREPGNIGMVCRAMANFGITDLRLVNPCYHLAPEAVKFAVAAKGLLGTAKIFPDLPAALADSHYSFAATRRSGRLRGELHPSSLLPALVADFPADSRVALVFGREDCGLSGDEVAACSAGVQILSSAEVGSLNLAQAVMVLLYELHRLPPEGYGEARELPEAGELEAVHRQMEEILDRVGFSNPACPAATGSRLRQIVNRARPDREETGLLRAMWSKLAESINNWPGRRRGEGPK